MRPVERGTSGRRPRRGWFRLPALAFGFVILSLVVLAVTPAVLVERLGELWTEFEDRIVPANQLATELRFQLERQAAAVRGFVLSEDPTYLDDYRAARVIEEESVARLAPLARRIDPAVTERLGSATRASDRLQELNVALLDGTLQAEQMTVTLARQESALDEALAELETLQAEIGQAAEERTAELGTRLVRQRAISFGLGVLAILVAAGVGWFARRQDALSAELARSAAGERLLREEAELRRDELERITESRARLMRGFSHDVKNPLGAADGYLQILEAGIAGRLGPKQAESVAGARRSIGAALHLIEDLLELARAETGRIRIEQERVDVREVLKDAVDEYRAQAEAKDLFMTIDLSSELPATESDSARIRQVVSNLLSNAVKFTERGGVTVRAEPRTDGAAPGPGEWIAIDVADTGPGIPEDEQRYLFQEFARLTGGEGKRGAGIGLAISRRIAHALDGDISVRSEVGRGSTFTLWLPIRARPAASPAAAA